MTEEQTSSLDVWGDWEPVVLEEQDAPDFSKPIRGKYKAVIETVEYKEVEKKDGDGNWEIINLKMKINKDIEGDKSFSRKIDKSFFMGTSDYNDDPIAGYKNLLNCLKSSDLYADWMKSDDIRGSIEEMNTKLKDKEVFITAFPKGDKQQIRIVKPKDATKTDDGPKSKFAV
jgi:hypothetical protein